MEVKWLEKGASHNNSTVVARSELKGRVHNSGVRLVMLYIIKPVALTRRLENMLHVNTLFCIRSEEVGEKPEISKRVNIKERYETNGIDQK